MTASLILTTPEQHDLADPTVERNPRRLQRWLDDLPRYAARARIVPGGHWTGSGEGQCRLDLQPALLRILLPEVPQGRSAACAAPWRCLFLPSSGENSAGLLLQVGTREIRVRAARRVMDTACIDLFEFASDQ